MNAMRTLTKLLLVASGASLFGLVPRIAHAQQDMYPPLPNVLLLVDTSGSMSYLISGASYDQLGTTPKLPGDVAAPNSACNGSVNSTTTRNRWTTLVETLTGTIPSSAFSCETLDRGGASFANEYGLMTSVGTRINPYDYNYFLPFHRLYVNGCTVAPQTGLFAPPSTPAGNFWWSGQVGFNYHTAGGAACTPTGQNSDGLLDAFASRVRFGVMMFDTLPNAGTGVTSATTPYEDAPTGEAGMWSYWVNWPSAPLAPSVPNGSNTSAHVAQPTGCTNYNYYEVGGRNQAAPPWEGRLIGFGDPASDSQIASTNATIQNELLAMRPFGGTPIAGIMDDAYQFLFNDTSIDSSTGLQSGPSNDPYWQNGCRQTYIILLTDGAPNLDLSGQCTAGSSSTTSPHNGGCPYLSPAQTAANLVGVSTNQSVKTYVVGFTPKDLTGVTGAPPAAPGLSVCQSVDPTASYCTTTSPAPAPVLQACCTLNQIAAAGGTGTGFYANNASELKQAISQVLSVISSGSTARTWPIYFPAPVAAVQGTSFATNAAVAYQFNASFTVPISDPSGTNPQSAGLWSGNLTRTRYTCGANSTASATPISKSAGDDYATNLNGANSAHPRKFLTAVPAVAASDSLYHGERTLRPGVPSSRLDGFGVTTLDLSFAGLTGAPWDGTNVQSFQANLANFPGVFNITNASITAGPPAGPCVTAFGSSITQAQCVSGLLNWEVGVTNNFAGVTNYSRNQTGCQAGSNCSMLGAIYHSTPTISGPPADGLRDQTYIQYQQANTQQPEVLYTATTDGQLHAFKVSAMSGSDTATTDTQWNNELWSFIPPVVLPQLLSNYNTGTPLLDGAPVWADVRSFPDPRVTGYSDAGAGNASNWRRILVASGGLAVGTGFYYAVDITNPLAPVFLWQLSTDAAGIPMFGGNAPTPAITNISIRFANADAGAVPTEIPVAILPGGSGTAAGGSQSAPSRASGQNVIVSTDANNPSNPSNTLNPITLNSSASVNTWNRMSGQATGNSVTIVRLETGEVIAHLTGTGYWGAPGGGTLDPTYVGKTVFTPLTTPAVHFSSPMTGVPAPYPNSTGDVADRIYIGDADGQLWKIDVSKPDISQWTINVAWDAYLLNGDTYAKREPIQTPPVLSRDTLGNTTILYSTGDQNRLSAANTTTATRIYSLTDSAAAGTVSANWWIDFGAAS